MALHDTVLSVSSATDSETCHAIYSGGALSKILLVDLCNQRQLLFASSYKRMQNIGHIRPTFVLASVTHR